MRLALDAGVRRSRLPRRLHVQSTVFLLGQVILGSLDGSGKGGTEVVTVGKGLAARG